MGLGGSWWVLAGLGETWQVSPGLDWSRHLKGSYWVTAGLRGFWQVSKGIKGTRKVSAHPGGFWWVSAGYGISKSLIGSQRILVGLGGRTVKSCKRCKRRLRIFCRKSCFLEIFLSQMSRIFLLRLQKKRVEDEELRVDKNDLRKGLFMN